MSTSDADISAGRIRHMEMVQSVITRLATNSFLIKGWAVTLASALLGLAVSKSEPKLAWIALVPVLLFWGLDAYFLYAERLFRGLYDQVRKSNPAVEPFYMAATSEGFRKELASKGVTGVTFRDAFWRPTVWLFHTTLVVAIVLVAVALRAG